MNVHPLQYKVSHTNTEGMNILMPTTNYIEKLLRFGKRGSVKRF